MFIVKVFENLEKMPLRLSYPLADLVYDSVLNETRPGISTDSILAVKSFITYQMHYKFKSRSKTAAYAVALPGYLIKAIISLISNYSEGDIKSRDTPEDLTFGPGPHLFSETFSEHVLCCCTFFVKHYLFFFT